MAFRTDVSIDWTVSPRIITIDSPSTTISIQDLYDTLRILEARVYNLAYSRIISAGGKEALGTSRFVGVTVTLLNALLKFEDRVSDTFCTVTDGNIVALDVNGDPVLSPLAFSTQVNARIELDVSPALIGSTVLANAVKDLIIDDTGASDVDLEDVLCRLNAYIRGRVVRTNGVGAGNDSDFDYYGEDDSTIKFTNRKLADDSERIAQ